MTTSKAKSLVIAGYGLNCEEETSFALEHVGFDSKIMHINDLAESPEILNDVQTLCIPGGFSYGDDTGSGNAFAQKMRLTIWDNIKNFVEKDTLTLGICNGCQISVNLGLAPALDNNYGQREVAVTHNLTARYQCRWIDVKVQETNSPWLEGIKTMHIPVAHGEGRFMMSNKTLSAIKQNNQIALKYVKADGSSANGQFPFNPNGSTEDIAGITDPSGRVLAMMPHPERGMFSWQRDDYHALKDTSQRNKNTLNEESNGMKLFKNAAKYFEIKQQKCA
jgi:phosphoribosylformylglycinamidine synthase